MQCASMFSKDPVWVFPIPTFTLHARSNSPKSTIQILLTRFHIFNAFSKKHTNISCQNKFFFQTIWMKIIQATDVFDNVTLNNRKIGTFEPSLEKTANIASA